jgi:hypothetical protein
MVLTKLLLEPIVALLIIHLHLTDVPVSLRKLAYQILVLPTKTLPRFLARLQLLLQSTHVAHKLTHLLLLDPYNNLSEFLFSLEANLRCRLIGTFITLSCKCLISYSWSALS